MAYIQKSKPPPNQILNFRADNFVGGLNNINSQLKPNECSNVMNMAFTNDIVMDKRDGTRLHTPFKYDGQVTLIDDYKPYNESDKLIVATDKKIYIDEVEIATVNGLVTGSTFNGRYFFVDGTALKVYGKFPQTAGTYVKIVGTPNPNYTLMKVVNPPVGYTPLPVEHTKGVFAMDYTKGEVWYEPCEFEVKDTNKGTNVLPSNPRFLIVHHGRIFISGDTKDVNNVFITDVATSSGNAFYYPVYLPIQLPPNGDKVVGITSYDNAVVVGRERDVFAINGSTNNPDSGLPMFELEKLNTHTGFANHRSTAHMHNYLVFMGRDGIVYSLSTVKGGERYTSTAILSRTVNLLKDPINATLTDITSSSIGFYNDEVYVRVKDKVLVYNYRYQAWTMYNNIPLTFPYERIDTLLLGCEDGTIRVFDPELRLDMDVPYHAFWRSKWFDMDRASHFKQFREFYVVGHTFETFQSDIGILFEVDYENVNLNHVVRNEKSIWGISEFGDRFIDRNINASIPIMVGRRARQIRFTISNGFERGVDVERKSDLFNVEGVKDGLMCLVKEEQTYYVFNQELFDWLPQKKVQLNQALRIYSVDGDYELRGKR